MTRKHLEELFEYDRWATRKLFDVVSTLNAGQYEKDLGSSHGGIRGTLVHAYGAMVVWLKRWNGDSPTKPITEEDIPSFADLRKRWEALEEDLAAHLRSVSEAKLQAPLAYKNMKGEALSTELWKQMQHLVNHGTYHRGQVVAMLRQLRVKPPTTDMIYFYLDRGRHA